MFIHPITSVDEDTRRLQISYGCNIKEKKFDAILRLDRVCAKPILDADAFRTHVWKTSVGPSLSAAMVADHTTFEEVTKYLFYFIKRFWIDSTIRHETGNGTTWIIQIEHIFKAHYAL